MVRLGDTDGKGKRRLREDLSVMYADCLGQDENVRGHIRTCA